MAVSRVTFVAFDFETTGLYAGQDSIVEFGAVKFLNGQVLERPIPAAQCRRTPPGFPESAMTC